MWKCQTSSFFSSPLFFTLTGYMIDYHWNERISWQNCLRRGHPFKYIYLFNAMKNEDNKWWNEIIFYFSSLVSDKFIIFLMNAKYVIFNPFLLNSRESFLNYTIYSDFQIIFPPKIESNKSYVISVDWLLSMDEHRTPSIRKM